MAGLLRRIGRRLGYEVLPIEPPSTTPGKAPDQIAPIEPIWPLPRRAGGLDDAAIRAKFAAFDQWHYSYAFEGGLNFGSHHARPGATTGKPERPLQRFRHFVPHLAAACGGSLAGQRILDSACNSGFFSMQCALHGAAWVSGFDVRQELVDQAQLIAEITGAANTDFKVGDLSSLADMYPPASFDAVMLLGILYHHDRPVEALEAARALSRKVVLVDTAVMDTVLDLVRIKWEGSDDIRYAGKEGVVVVPSPSALEAMFRHVGFRHFYRVPVTSDDMPLEYRRGRRMTWILEV